MADNDIWITSRYLTNPDSNSGKTHMPTLKMKDAQGCSVLMTSNEEKSEVLTKSLSPPLPLPCLSL